MSYFVPLPLVESSLPHPRLPTSVESLNVPRPFWVESLNVPRLPTSVESLNVPGGDAI
nr:hypothetical protein Q903MT_gene1202 [Picea sitchensis]